MRSPSLALAVVASILYGRLDTDPTVLAEISAPVMGIFGDQDEGIAPEAVDAFAEAMKAIRPATRAATP